jgi:lysine N6-hydroxylase
LQGVLFFGPLNNDNHLPELRTGCELRSITKNTGNDFTIKRHHTQTEKTFEEATESIILATGYQTAKPVFTEGIRQIINWAKEEEYALNENYSIDNNHSIFVQNADWHTHGFNSADLGLGPHRNSVIINSILQKEVFSIATAGVWQQFTP